jgi:phosphate transport system substrate-binding protein
MRKYSGFLILLLFLGCSVKPLPEQATIRIKGSDTMLILNRRWAEEYMKTHSGISVYVEGGGSAVGIKALINGDINICAASRPLRPEESQFLAQKYNTVGLSFLVAKDALSIYINPSNPVRNLTTGQVKNIFTGKINNWKAVGGDSAEITVLIRSPNSDTYLYLKEHTLNEEEYSRESITKPTTASIVQFIRENPLAIGYGGFAYGKDLVHCPINGVPPTIANIRNDTYPLTRYLYFYTIDTPPKPVQTFIDWVMSRTGQEIVKQVGYIPLWGKRE